MKLPFDLRALWERALRWYHTHSPREQRIILGVVVASVLSLVYIGVVEPVLDYRKAVAQEIADGQEELERSLRFLAAKDTLRAERDDLRKKLSQAKTRLLPGGTGTLGAAALQERTNAIATEKGITPQSTQVMKEETVEPYRKVSVRLTLSGELKALAELVSGLEYGQQLSVPFVEISRRGAVAGGKGPRTLSVTMEVSGFVQGSGKQQASEAEEAAAAVPPAEGTAAGAPTEPVAEAGGGAAAETSSSTTESANTTSTSTTTTVASSSSTTSSPAAGANVTTTPRGVPTTLPHAPPPPMPGPHTTRPVPPPAAGRAVPAPVTPPPSAPIILGAPPTPEHPPAAGVPPLHDAPPMPVQPQAPVEPQMFGQPAPPPPAEQEDNYEEEGEE